MKKMTEMAYPTSTHPSNSLPASIDAPMRFSRKMEYDTENDCVVLGNYGKKVHTIESGDGFALITSNTPFRKGTINGA